MQDHTHGVVTPGTGTVSCCPAPNSFVPDQYLTPTKQRATGDPAISCASSPHSINTRSSLKRRGIILNSDSEQQHDATRKKLKFGRKELMKLNKEDRVNYFVKYLETCKCSNTNCTCLDILKEDDDVRKSVAHYLATFEMKSRYEQNSIIMDWYRYSQAARVGRKYVWYCLPYDVNWCFDSDDYDDNDVAVIVEAAKEVKLCTSGMRSVMNIGTWRFQSIRDASDMGVFPLHRLKGKRSNAAIKDAHPKMVHLKAHFSELYTFAEDRAIKTIITEKDGERGHANRLENDEKVYLPIYMGFRNSYYRYCESLGYVATVGPNGSITLVDKEGTKQDKVSYTMYQSYWKDHHPNLKVSKPQEDICQYCYTFTNMYKILTEKEKEEQSDDDDGTIGDESIVVVDDAIDNESSGLDKYIDHNNIDTDDIEGHDMEAVEQILQTINLNVMGAAATKAREAKEQLILTCRKHIKMARAQRVLYQQKEQEARDDVKQQVPHSQRRVTITADFGQNIEIPCFNSQQPGCTYYYSTLTINNFGVVDHSHVMFTEKIRLRITCTAMYIMRGLERRVELMLHHYLSTHYGK
jgi:hypothetical protein